MGGREKKGARNQRKRRTDRERKTGKLEGSVDRKHATRSREEQYVGMMFDDVGIK